MNRKILFVDDERMTSEGYKTALEKKFEVVYLASAEDGLEYIRRNVKVLSAAVLDVMMPAPSEALEVETCDGFETGLWLLECCQAELAEDWPFPVVILTNRLTSMVREGLSRRSIREDTIDIRRKIETPAFALPKWVEHQINRFA